MVVADLTLELPLPRGVLVGLAAAIKVTPVILIAYLFLTRQGRSGAHAIASFGVAALFAAAVNSSTSWAYWTHDIHDPQRAGDLVAADRQPGTVRRARAHAGPHLHDHDDLVLVVTVGAVGLVVAAGPLTAPRRCWGSSSSRPPSPSPAPCPGRTTSSGWSCWWPGWRWPRTGRARASGTPSGLPCSFRATPGSGGHARAGRGVRRPGAGSSRSRTARVAVRRPGGRRGAPGHALDRRTTACGRGGGR